MPESTAAVAFDAKEIIKDMLAGFVSSAACVYTGQPFDTVKVRLQYANLVNIRGLLTVASRLSSTRDL